MDFLSMTELKGEEHGMLVCKDSLATWCWLFPCAAFNSLNVEEAVLMWSSVFGMPRMLVTDSGTHFKNELVKALTLRMRCMHHCTTPYAHWAHGVAERLNRTIIKVFRVLLSENATDYHDWVPLTPTVQSTINQHSSNQRLDSLSANQVMLSREVPTPLDTVSGAYLKAAGIDSLPDNAAVRAAYTEAAEAMQSYWVRVTSAREKRAAQNRAQRAKISAPEDFKLGDFVLCRWPTDVKRNKLRVRWLGPYRVVDTINERVFVIEDIIRHKRTSVHGQRLQYYADNNLNLTQDLRNQAAYDDKYWVSKFVDWRIDDDDQLQLRIRWQGFMANEDTWEDPDRMHADVPVMLISYLHTILDACPSHVTPLLIRLDPKFEAPKPAPKPPASRRRQRRAQRK